MPRSRLFLGTWAALFGFAVPGIAAARQPAPPADIAAALRSLEAGDTAEKLAALTLLRRSASDNQLGGQKADTIKLCARLLRDKDSELADAAGDVLSWLDPDAALPLVEILQVDDPHAQSRAARVLAQIAARHPSQLVRLDVAIAPLTKLLVGESQAARHNAFYALSELGPNAIPHMVEALDAEEYFQWVMMKGFVRHGERSVEPLCKALRTGDVSTRRNAGFMLFHLAWRAPEVIPFMERKALGPLTEAIHDEDQRVCAAAIDTLGRMESRAQPALNEILAALQRADAPFRSIADAARRIGPEAEHVAALFDGAERMVHAGNDLESAAQAFGQAVAAVGEDSVERVIRGLDDRREAARETALWACYYLGPKAAPAAEIIIRKLNGGDKLAPAVLGSIGPPAQAAVPDLIRQMQHDTWVQSRRASSLTHDSECAKALAAIGPTALPHVLHGLKHESDLVKAGCLVALEKMDAVAGDSLSAVEPLCRHTNPLLRFQALLVLMHHGLAEDKLLPLLTQLQHDPHPLVAGAARKALARLQECNDCRASQEPSRRRAD
jgi:HEAT repeat protein